MAVGQIYGEGVEIALEGSLENAGSLYLQMQLGLAGYSPIELKDFSQTKDNFPNSRFLGVGRFGGFEKQILDLTDWLKVHPVEELPEATKLYIRFVANM
jgi:hypothetical protein